MTTAPGSPAPRRPGWIEWWEQRLNLTEIFSFLTTFGVIYTPVDTRRPLREALREVGEQRIPRIDQGPRILSVLAAILFLLQAATGLLLAYYYRPTPEAAYASTGTILRDVPSGWFIHQMHAWGAWLLVAVIVARLLRLFWDGLYRAPREVLWWCAVAITWIVIQMDFTGRLLVWDATTYWSTVRGLELVFSIPIVGPILRFLLGGRTVNEFVLIRFYVLHVMVLPITYAALLYLTFATLRRVGLARTAPEVEETVRYRDHLFLLSMLLVVLFAVLVTLATLAPFHFGQVADPYVTPPGTRPPWYMLAPYVLMHLPIPAALTGLVLLVAAFAVLLLPLWLRGQGTPESRRRIRLVGAAIVVAWFALTILAEFLERRPR